MADYRIWVVWQPHTYSRIQALWSEFCLAFNDADRVVLSDVYAARENAPADFSRSDLAADIRHKQVNLIPKISDIENFLVKQLAPGDVLLVLSAGDADTITKSLYKLFQSKQECSN